MDFIDELRALSAKIQKEKDLIQTEEATKAAFILPFIKALGYDIFDPTEVVPEFTADVGIKKGEKVDFALKRENKIIMLIECKVANLDLADEHVSQLFHYFSVTAARIGVLTNGIIYRFYTDIEESNKMDLKPFMEFNMIDMQEHLVEELKRFTKQSFPSDLDEIHSVAGEMKFTREIKQMFRKELIAPSEDFVKFFAKRVYNGKITQSVSALFTTITRKAFIQFINDTINERLRLPMTEPPSGTEGPEKPPTETKEGIVTTPEELEGYYIVKAILHETADPSRIVHLDKKNYFIIRLDNSSHKPICRFYFDKKQKCIGFIDKEKREERVPIESLDDIYKYSDRLKATVAMYINPKSHISSATAPERQA